MQMNKGAVIGIVVGVAVLIILISTVIWSVSTYNKLVALDEGVEEDWAQVENKYQLKIDLIPALVAEVDKYQEFEESTLTNITALRSRWMEASGDPDEQLDISNQLDGMIRSIVLTVEEYPYLRSIEAVNNLMVSLEGTENRISTERMRYNEGVREYNTKIKQFPSVIIASMGGFEKRAYFESDAAPENP
ncbi:MAG: LemA family protein [Thermoplasmatota archaeon]